MQTFCGGCLIFCFEWHLWIFHAYSINLPWCHLLIHHWCNAPDYETDAIECTGSVIARLWGIIIVGYMVCHRGRRLILAPGLNTLIFVSGLCFLLFVHIYLLNVDNPSTHIQQNRINLWLSDHSIKYSCSPLRISNLFKDRATASLPFASRGHWDVTIWPKKEHLRVKEDIVPQRADSSDSVKASGTFMNFRFHSKSFQLHFELLTIPIWRFPQEVNRRAVLGAERFSVGGMFDCL